MRDKVGEAASRAMERADEVLKAARRYAAQSHPYEPTGEITITSDVYERRIASAYMAGYSARANEARHPRIK